MSGDNEYRRTLTIKFEYDWDAMEVVGEPKFDRYFSRLDELSRADLLKDALGLLADVYNETIGELHDELKRLGAKDDGTADI